MTDEEITIAVAENVMGLKLGPLHGEKGFIVNGGRVCLHPNPIPGNTVAVEFAPLTDDADSCAVLDKMVEKKWCYELTFDDDGHCCTFDNQTIRGGVLYVPMVLGIEDFCESRNRAICLAALRACGVDV